MLVTDGVPIQEAREGVVVVSPSGELDAYTTPGLRSELHRLVEEGSRTLVVDLTDVTFLDSSALGVLVGTLKRLRERQGELRIVEPRPLVRRAFEVTSLDQILALYPTREDALQHAETTPSATSPFLPRPE